MDIVSMTKMTKFIIMEYFGNQEIMKLEKTAFLCSRRVPADVVLKSYDWAKEQRQSGNCIICGNHSQIEQDVFEILLKGDQPIILVLARGMKSRWESAILNAIREDRLLIISPFNKKIKRITRKTAKERNKFIIDKADQLMLGYFTPGGQLDTLTQNNDYSLL